MRCSAERKPGKTRAFRWKNRISHLSENTMKKSAVKFCVWICVLACLATIAIFVGQSSDVSASAENETAANPESKIERRCGWFSNPTPANAWLNDKDGEWLISMQGGYQAEGDWGTDFKPNQWIETNVHYGYGCACMSVTTNKKTRHVLTIKNFKARPLSACRKDRKLKEPK